MLLRASLALSRYGAENLVGWVVGLDITRERGAWGAAIVACFFVTALEHGGAIRNPSAPPSTDAGRWNRERVAALSACSVALLYFAVSAFALAIVAVLARITLGLHAGALFELLEPGDLARGALTAVVLGLVPFAWTFVCGGLFATSTRSLGVKLFVAWLGALAMSAMLTFVGGALLPVDADSPARRMGAESIPGM